MESKHSPVCNVDLYINTEKIEPFINLQPNYSFTLTQRK